MTSAAADDLSLALELADRADAISSARFRAKDLRVDTKPDDSPVTDADHQIEEMIRTHVASRRPSHAVLGEEGGSSGDAEWRWIVDPIDGTKNFARGVPVWATLISLQHAGEETCAVVSAPALRHRWWASRGGGAMCDGELLRVSTVSRLADATLSFTDVRDFARYGWQAGFDALAARCRITRGFGDFWSHMLVAEGAIDCGLEPVINEWDISAAQLIIREAGGRLSDFAGVDHARGANVVTSNGLIHDEVLGCLAVGRDPFPAASPIGRAASAGGGDDRRRQDQRVTEATSMTTQQCPMCGDWIDDDSVDFCPTCGEVVTTDDGRRS